MIDTVLQRVFPRSLTLRLLAVAFVGIHVPLLVLAGWLLASGALPLHEALGVLLVVLIATLVGTGATLWVLHRMFAPLREAFELFEASKGQLPPRLPEGGDDEVGRLLRSINRSLQGADADLRDLEREAQTDPLTSALNRRGCEQALADSVQRAQAGKWPFVLFVVDLDNLKQLNDQHGHAAGDEALVRLTHAAQQWLGPRDWFGRWGGDEFLIGLHLKTEQACAQVETWRARLEADGGGGPRPLYLSAGAATHGPGEDAHDLYRRADAAMYRAKFSGGRRLLLDDGNAPA